MFMILALTDAVWYLLQSINPSYEITPGPNPEVSSSPKKKRKRSVMIHKANPPSHDMLLVNVKKTPVSRPKSLDIGMARKFCNAVNV
jgi:hypothetical protein